MQSQASTVTAYLAELPTDRKTVVADVRRAIKRNLPAGFVEIMQYGMISYVVPLVKFPAGYHTTPNTPLPFIALAAQKNYVALYHMGLYGNRTLLAWFTKAYAAADVGKLDMGKSCIRFKKIQQVPVALLAELASKISMAEYIAQYQAALRSK
jgi:uncharacterized protein YdhG (YjbR/CyaY superfamily)